MSILEKWTIGFFVVGILILVAGHFCDKYLEKEWNDEDDE